MLIMLSGIPVPARRQEREFYLEKIYSDAELLLAKGHTPVVSLKTAARLASNYKGEIQTENTKEMTLALASKCDAVLILQDGFEIDLEREVIQRKGCPVYTKIEEIPTNR